MSVYLDTSALAKLVVAEPESDALRTWVGGRPDDWRVTNVVGVVELQRMAARVSQAALSVALQLLTRIDQLDLTPAVLLRAAQVPLSTVRTLDALHIGSAAELADLEALVTYDVRMATAARGCGLPVVSPGAA